MPAEPREYKPKTNHYFNMPADKLTSTFDREQYRQELIFSILNSPAKSSFKDHPHLIDTTDGIFTWKEDKIKDLDDVALYSVSTLVRRQINNENNY